MLKARRGTPDRTSLNRWYAAEAQRAGCFSLKDVNVVVTATVDRRGKVIAQLGPAPALGRAFDAQIVEPLAPVLASVLRPTG